MKFEKSHPVDKDHRQGLAELVVTVDLLCEAPQWFGMLAARAILPFALGLIIHRRQRRSNHRHLPLTSLPRSSPWLTEMFFAVAVVFHQIRIGDTVSAIHFGDAAGWVKDELDFARAVGGAWGIHYENDSVDILQGGW